MTTASQDSKDVCVRYRRGPSTRQVSGAGEDEISERISVARRRLGSRAGHPWATIISVMM
jgi:hypothetical protein